MKFNLLKIAMITIIITIIIIISILILLNNDEIIIDDEEVGHIDFSQIDIVSERNEYFSVKNMFDKYNNAINQLDEDEQQIYVLNDIIDSECKQFLKLNIDNMLENLKKYKNSVYDIENMYYVEKNINTKLYYIEGRTDSKNKLKIIIKTDSYTETFSIYTQQYIEEKGYDETSIQNYFEIEQIEYIEANDNNKYNIINVTNDMMAQYYLDDYSNKIINNINSAYEILNNEYKEKRFPTLEDYSKYIYESNKNYNFIVLDEYFTKEYNNYIEFICKDQDGDIYIFKDTAIMEYTVQLDDYTLQDKEIEDEYAKKTDEEKVRTNIEKIFKMINMKDFKSVYQYLDKTFRENNFETLEEFESYMRATFFNSNVLGNITIQEQGQNYIIKVPYKDGYSSVAEKKTKNFIMKLQENTDFIISFER